jgi:phenylalanyl-tRNA synthetase beta chain
MKVSLNWVKQYLDFELPPVEELVEKIGAQLGAVEEVVDLGKKYQEIFIVKVIECQKIENADKLSLCKVDDGGKAKDVERDSNGLVQVVCGAPNVKEGMMAAWLPPGAVVPASANDEEPFVLEAREIRGHKSNGMLASPQELALGDSHAGLLNLDTTITGQAEEPDIKAGDDFAETYGLNDHIIDIENKMFTHRPDCFGHLGVAREIAGILGKPFKSPAGYKAPKTPASAGPGDMLEIHNELPELVPRFVAQVFEDVNAGPSPVCMQARLSSLGLRPINNIVDITNYFMLLTGQPLHAYDYDKVKALSGGDKAVIVVRNPKPGEKLKLLNGKEIEPRTEAIMIATDKQAIGLGGVMGGGETEVDDKTKNIILECANFDMYSTRRTAMEHGIFTDAVTRFNKGQSPLQNERVVIMARDQIICDSGAMPADIIDGNNLSDDIKSRDSLFMPVKVTAEFINRRLGLELKAEEMKKLLENVEFEVEVSGEELTARAPFWRTDIELREDVVEEVGRLYGYDHLPLVLPERYLTPAKRDAMFDLKAGIRERLSKAGANELLTYSFVSGGLLDKAGQDVSKAYQVANALSPDLQYYRMSLVPSLLDKVHANIKTGYDEFALFEIGRVHDIDHVDDDGLPLEMEYTGLVVTAADKLKKQGAAYYQAQKYLQALVNTELSFKPIDKSMAGYPVVQPYNPDRAAFASIKGGNFLGIIGEFKPGVARSLKLPKYTAGFEIDTTELKQIIAAGPSYAELSRFPKVSQDLSLKVPGGVSFEKVYDVVGKAFGANAMENTHTGLEPLDIYRPDDGSRHFAFRFTVTGLDRTLTDKEVAKVLDAVAGTAAKELKAERL